MKPTVTKTVKKDYRVVITEDEIRKRFRLPADAFIEFKVPTGEYKGFDDGVAVGNSLTATWSREK